MNHAHWPLIVAPASLPDRRAPEVNTARDDGQATLLEVTAPEPSLEVGVAIRDQVFPVGRPVEQDVLGDRS